MNLWVTHMRHGTYVPRFYSLLPLQSNEVADKVVRRPLSLCVPPIFRGYNFVENLTKKERNQRSQEHSHSECMCVCACVGVFKGNQRKRGTQVSLAAKSCSSIPSIQKHAKIRTPKSNTTSFHCIRSVWVCVCVSVCE